MPNDNIQTLLAEILDRRILKKAVLSKPVDKQVLKSVAEPFVKADGAAMLRLERFTRDNKAYQRNLPYSCAAELTEIILTGFRQVNIFTSAGNIEVLISKSGAVHISGKLGADASEAGFAAHNDGKRYIIDPSRDVGFLTELGLADANGRIHDKKQAKFRQINRFLEIVRDVESALPAEPVIYDLCCGKSYLTFAVYYYFTVLKKIKVRMYGVDLKQDVIEYCNAAAARQGFSELRFVSGNINDYTPPEKPDMVISLHACDIATDIVLYNAVRWGAKLILSTPCCHHEMSGQLSKPAENAPLRGELAFILSSPMLKQKLCDAATDALRVKRLESCGYDVTTLELIDPDDTPKNLMLRAVLPERANDSKKAEALSEYRQICTSLGVSPYLDRLLTDES